MGDNRKDSDNDREIESMALHGMVPGYTERGKVMHNTFELSQVLFDKKVVEVSDQPQSSGAVQNIELGNEDGQ